MSWGNKKNISYVQPNKNANENKAAKYASSMMKTNVMNPTLQMDYEKILNGGCTYLPNYFCKTNDMTIFDKLKSELNTNNITNWSKHFKYDDPDISSTFTEIVEMMGKHFNVEILQTRLNYYKDGNDWKPMHKDRHAYGEGDNKIREDFTMGASFGSGRMLEFVHEESNTKFSFPQNNGDIFAFDSDINKKFLHGIPKSFKPIGERFSIIAWGRKN
jgi:hypothetical protein